MHLIKYQSALAETYTRTRVDVEKLLINIENIIIAHGKYMSKREISNMIKVPRTTLGFIVDTDIMCSILGFPRPRLKPKGDPEIKIALVNAFIEEYCEFIKSRGESTSLYRFLREHKGLSNSEASRYYRYGISVEDCHIKAGVKYVPGYGKDIYLIENILRNMICTKKRYITTNELAIEVGLTGSAIRQMPLDVISINYEYGMIYRGKSFEMYVLELLKDTLPYYTIETQKTFPDCVSTKGKVLRFDFYIVELNTLIEVDGDQHYLTNHPWYSKDQAIRDFIKDTYCKTHNISLLRITSRDFKNINAIISEIPLKLSVGQSAAEPNK